MEISKLLLVPLVVLLFIIIDTSWEILREKQRIRRLVDTINAKQGEKQNPMLILAGQLLGWYGRRTLSTRLAQAGNPRFFGESSAHFYTAKLLLAIVVGLRIGGRGLPLLLLGMVGFMIPDVLIYLAARRRKEEILQTLPEMLDFLRRALAGGTGMRETLSALPQRVSGPLRKEVIQLAAHYALTLDLTHSLDAFAARIGLEEMDHLVLSLKQSEVTGRVKTLLAYQAEVLKVRRQAEIEKSMKNRANFLPLISVMVVANIMILIAIPLLIQFTSSFGQF